MANIKLSFFGTDSSGSENTELQCFKSSDFEIVISINDTDCDHQFSKQFILLDKSTAIKLAKTLRTEINKISYL